MVNGGCAIPQTLINLMCISGELYPRFIKSPEYNFNISQVGSESLKDGHESAVAAEVPTTPEPSVDDRTGEIRNQTFALLVGCREASVGSGKNVEHFFPTVFSPTIGRRRNGQDVAHRRWR